MNGDYYIDSKIREAFSLDKKGLDPKYYNIIFYEKFEITNIKIYEKDIEFFYKENFLCKCKEEREFRIIDNKYIAIIKYRFGNSIPYFTFKVFPINDDLILNKLKMIKSI